MIFSEEMENQIHSEMSLKHSFDFERERLSANTIYTYKRMAVCEDYNWELCESAIEGIYIYTG